MELQVQPVENHQVLSNNLKTRTNKTSQENQEANYAYPLRNAVCMRTSVTRWKLYDNWILCRLPDTITHF